jgi:hypothetical protein
MAALGSCTSGCGRAFAPGHNPKPKESEMSRYIKSLLVVGLVAGLAACAAPVPEQEEIIFVDPAPIHEEPVYNKYN